VTPNGEQICVGSESSVYLENIDLVKLRNRVDRKPLEITCCAVDDDNQFIMFASLDPDVSVLEIASAKTIMRIPTGGNGVRQMCYGNGYLCVVDYSGNILIVELELSNGLPTGYNIRAEGKGVAELSYIRQPSNSYKCAWSVSRTLALFPSKMGSMLCYYKASDGEWTETYVVSNTGNLKHLDHVHLVSFSSDGQLLSTADVTGRIIIWSVKNTDDVPKFTALMELDTGLSKGDSLVDTLWYREELIVMSQTKYEVYSNLTVREPAAAPIPSTTGKSRLKKKGEDTVKEKEDDDDWPVDNIESIESIKRSTIVPATMSPGGTDDDSDDEDDEDAVLPPTEVVAPAAPAIMVSALNMGYHGAIRISSTKPDEKGRQYLAWNSVGSITSKAEEISNRIEIRFANKSRKNKQEIFNDNWGFVMAALSHEGAVFATRAIPDERKDVSTGSTVHYHAFPTGAERLHGANDSFTVSLNNDEDARGVAVGCGWVAVASSRDFLRIFSSTGCQLAVNWLKGQTVSICGYENLLAVVYNTSPSFQGNYSLFVDLFEISPNDAVCMRCLSSIPLPLSNGSSLEWAGFSVDSLMFFIEDSAGIFSMLSSQGPNGSTWCWTPVLEVERIRKSAGHKYWPVTILENKLAYVLLSGENKPAIYPEPVVATHPFRIPICESKENRDKADETTNRVHELIFQLGRGGHMQYLFSECQAFGRTHTGISLSSLEDLHRVQQTEFDRTVLKLFQEACRTQRNSQAIDLALKLKTEKALSAAMTVANHFGRSLIAQRVEEIISFRNDIVADAEPRIASYSRNVAEEQTTDSDFHHGQHRESAVMISDDMPAKRPAVNPFVKTTQPSGTNKRQPALDMTDFQSPAKKSALSVSCTRCCVGYSNVMNSYSASPRSHKKRAQTKPAEEWFFKLLKLLKYKIYSVFFFTQLFLAGK
jgi:hypothetical protein